MMRTLLFILLFVFSKEIIAQGFITETKKRAKKQLSSYAKQNNYTRITETENSLSFLVRDPALQHFDLVLDFNEMGRCYRETRTTPCDSCFQKYLRSALDTKSMGWVKMNELIYLSRYKKKLMLEIIQPTAPYSFSITQKYWSKEEYNRFLPKASE
jgi:hypothetical protein